MVKLKCTQCGETSKVGTKFCPNCGGSLAGVSAVNVKGSKGKKAIVGIIGVVVIILCVVIALFVIPNLKPKSKYNSLIAQGKINEADALYNEKIASDEKLVKELVDEQNVKMQEIYDKYIGKNLTYDEAKEKLEMYKQSDVTKSKAYSIQKDIDSLKKSRESYEAAIKAETDGDVETAISKYKMVIDADENYKNATSKIEELGEKWRNELLTEASNYASNKKYGDAISTINKIISKEGSDDELTGLLDEYTNLKSEQYVKVVCVGKSTTPKNTSKWIFSNYVNFVFEVTNNSDKDIKGVEGVLTVNDLFGKEILSMGCDFLGQTIKPGDTYRESDLSFECNEFMDAHMKMYNTDFSDLQFVYEVESIVYSDGSTVVPE